MPRRADRSLTGSTAERHSQRQFKTYPHIGISDAFTSRPTEACRALKTLDGSATSNAQTTAMCSRNATQ